MKLLDAQRITDLLESVGLPAPQIGEQNWYQKIADALEILLEVAKAAKENRFSEESSRLVDALAKLSFK